MKKNIKDYIGKKYAVQCSTKEEWDKVCNLDTNKFSSLIKSSYNLSSFKLLCLSTEGEWFSSSSPEKLKKEGYTILQASEFLEEPKSLVGRYVKVLKSNSWSGTKHIGKYLKIIQDTKDTLLFEKYISSKFCKERLEDKDVWELMPENWSPEQEKPKFEIGKWYKAYDNPCHYMKSSKYDERYLYGSEYIYSDRQYSKGDYSWSLTDAKLLTDLTEIQPFLPNGHPDKLPEKPVDMTKEEMLQKAYRDYPIGTKFKSFCDNDRIRTVKPYISGTGKSEKTVTWHWSGGDIRCDNGMFTEDEKGNYACSNPTIYEPSKGWAEIISKPENKPNLSELYNCYIPLNNEEEYKQVTSWLKSNGWKASHDGWNLGSKNIIFYGYCGEYNILSDSLDYKKISIKDLAKYGFELKPIVNQPIMKDEWIPKEGEWVKIINQYGSLNVGQLYQIDRYQFDDYYYLKGTTSAPKKGRNFIKALPHEIPTSNSNIEIGDEIELVDGYSYAGYNIGDKAIVIDKNPNNYYFSVYQKGTTKVINGCAPQYWKIIKKNSQTTLNKTDDFGSLQVTNAQTTDIIIPKRASVTLKIAEKEVNINIKKQKPVKI